MNEKVFIIIQKYLLNLIKIFKLSVEEGEEINSHLSIQNIANNIEFVKESKNFQMIAFNYTYEDRLYRILFEKKPINNIYHYTSLSSLFLILKSKQLHLSSIAGLNDRSEMNYGDKILGKTILQSFHHKRIESANQRFVLSCTSKNDNLNQWRLYGNDGNGAMLGFIIDTSLISKHYFALGKIFYGDDFFTLIKAMNDELKNKTQHFLSLRRFFLWKNFIKPKDYLDEDEYRLLFFNNAAKGLTKGLNWYLNGYGIVTSFVDFNLVSKELPLIPTKIMLGPKCFEKQLNVAQLKYYLNEKSLKRIKVEYSRKEHYR